MRKSPHMNGFEEKPRSGPAGSRHIGLGAAVVAAFLWGFSGIFAVLAVAPGPVLTFYRLWIGVALLLIVTYSSGRRLTWAKMRASWWGGVLLGGEMIMFFSAVKLTSVVDVTVIGAAQPILVLIAARFLFREKIGKWNVLLILLAVSGVGLTVFGPGIAGHRQFIGDLLAVGCLLLWSAYWLVTKHYRKSHEAIEYTAGVMISAALTVTPLVYLTGHTFTQVKSTDWLWFCLLAIVPGGGHLIMNWAHRFVDASVSSAISCLSPLVAAVAAQIILDQPLTLTQVAGLLLGMAAISVLVVRYRSLEATETMENA